MAHTDDSQTWRINILHSTVFLMACNNLDMLLESPDMDRLAYQIVQRGIITREEIGDLVKTLTNPPFKDPELFEMYFEDILTLYTVMELNARMMISDAGDEIKNRMLANEETSVQEQSQMMEGFKGLLVASSGFVRSLSKEYASDEEFQVRKAQLAELDAYL
jgi:hypothetical protein